MSLWNDMTEVQKVAHSMRHGNQYHNSASPAMLRLAQQHNEERNGGGLGFGHDGSNPNGNTTNTPRTDVGEGVVGSDGLTNRERYDQRRAQEAAQQAAEQERLAALNANRPEGVSQYLWENIQSGGSFNPTLVTRDPAVRDALVNAGHGDYVKALYESQMDSAASHYMGNGASQQDAYGNAQDPWYTQQYGNYFNDTVQGSEQGLGFGHESTNPATGNPNYVPSQGGTPTGGFGDDPDFGAGVPTTDRDPNRSPMMDAYRAARAANPSPAGGFVPNDDTGFGPQPGESRAKTPYADAFMRSRQRAEAPGPVSGMMKKYME
jgi:hypothetical protein